MMNKSNALKWRNQSIQDAIFQCNRLDYNSLPYIEFLCQPTFSNDFLLQLVWQPKAVYWYRSTWLQDQDRDILNTWLEYMQDDEEILPLDLTFLRESGEINHKATEDLIQKINALSIKPILFDDGQWGRDGKEIILKIGSEKSYSVFHWYTCSTPQNWDDLDKLADTMLRLNQLLK